MKKTLVYRSPAGLPSRTLVWDISEKYLRDQAYTDLFKILDSELEAFSDADSVVCSLIDLARNGNPEACEALLAYRRNKADASFEEVEVRWGPTEPVLLKRQPRKVVTKVDDFEVTEALS